MKRPAALVVVRDPNVRALAVQVLEEQGFEVAATESADDREQLERLARRVIGDVRLPARPGSDGAHVQGASEVMQQVRAQIAAAARAADPVWIVGEPGSGRRAVARRIHATSARSEAPFAPLDCAEARDVDAFLSDDSRLDQAASGSLYLANITELRLDRQLDLLHALESRQRAAPGARVLFGLATDPARAVQEGRLLDELRQRFAGIAVPVPPLRERREDVAPLAASFLQEICEMNSLPPIRISSSALSLLEEYAWPGNVEELRGAIEQAVIVSSDEIIRPGDLPEAVRETAPRGRPRIPAGVSARPFREAKREVVNAFEKVYLGELLEQHRGNVTAAAHHAGMLRSALQRLLRKYRLKSADFRRSKRAARPAAGKSADDSR